MRRNFYSTIKPMRNIWINEQHDSDWDGVPNYRDCEPFNPRKHTISKTKKEQLKRVSLYVTDDPLFISRKGRLSYYEEKYKPGEKEAEQHAKYSSSVVRSLQKHYPGVISELERSKVEEIKIHGVPSKSKAKIYPLGFADVKGEKIIATPSPYEHLRSKETIKQYAHDLLHERKHIEQIKEGRMKDSVPISQTVALGKGYERYKKNPLEKEAEEFAQQKMKEYERKRKLPTGKQISRVLDLD